MYSSKGNVMQKNEDSVLPGLHHGNNYRYSNLKKFYNMKIEFLLDQKSSQALIRLICRDTPYELDNLASWWGKKRFIGKCIKYYRAQINALDRLHGKGWFLGWF